MQDIEFVTAFVVLLFGLALANVTNNVADSWRGRNDLPIGAVPIMIAAYIVLTIIDQYFFLAAGREFIPINLLSIAAFLAISLPFIFVSRLLMPLHPEHWTSQEAFYIANRREILIALIVPPVAAMLTNVGILLQMPNPPWIGLLFWSSTKALLVLIPLGLLFTASPRLHRIGFAFMIGQVTTSIVLRSIG